MVVHRTFLRGWTAAVILLTLGCACASAQEASIAGTVIDQSKSALAGVTVTATERASGRAFTAVTDDRGGYHLMGLPAGRYRLQAELPGFTTTTIPDQELFVGQNATIVFTLTVAGLSETVIVQGDPPLVNTQSAEVAGNVDPRQMQQLPIQGRNWMELAMMVKGITANDIGNNMPGVVRDTQFELNLDGQQITQKASHTPLFGQPAISREAIAQYQIVTNLFDITMGRSNGIQVQVVSRSGTNAATGSLLGNFRDSRFNAPDFVARRVLPYSNQQVAATFGAPIVKDKLLYFGSYEHEREPNTLVLSPPALAPQQLSLPTETTQHAGLARVDYQFGNKDHFMVRTMYFRRRNPFEEVAGTDYPTRASNHSRDSNLTTVNWTRVASGHLLQEVKASYYHYHWNYSPAAGVHLTPEYIFSTGLTIGPRWNYPENFFQDEASVRYDLSWQKASHDFKVGGEFMKARTSGWWRATERGQLHFTALPLDAARRFPLDAWNDPTRWDLTGLDQLATFFNQSYAVDWNMNIPRPIYGVWIGDMWAATKTLTLTLGLRYDLDWRASSPPGIKQTTILINNGRDPVEDVGYRNDIHDPDNVAPRVGFAWNVAGSNHLVIRGGSGLFYSVLDSEGAFRAQLYNGQRVITNSYTNDLQPAFVFDPSRGVSAANVLSGSVRLPPQSVTVLGHDFQTPYTWQSSLGVQKQLDSVMAMDTDLVFWRAYDEGSGRDPNLFYDPVTGFNKNPKIFKRPNPAYGQITLYESQGKADYLGLASSFTRRYRDHFQASATYTLMFFKHDNGTSDSGTGGFANNPFNRSAEWARSSDFQRHTLRTNGIFQTRWGMSVAGSFFFGSGNYFSTMSGVDPYGTGNTNVSRVRQDFSIIPRNNFKGRPVQKLDLRFSKEVPVRRIRLTGIAEVFNVYNHPNYGSYNLLESSSGYRQAAQNLSTSYLPRVWQIAFKVSF
jgi:hypothetical protein